MQRVLTEFEDDLNLLPSCCAVHRIPVRNRTASPGLVEPVARLEHSVRREQAQSRADELIAARLAALCRCVADHHAVSAAF